MLQVFINSGNGDVDYTHYVMDGSISIQRSLNTPSTCTLSLYNLDAAFQLPAQRSYLRIFSTQYNRVLYSGFMVNDPNYNFLAVRNKQSAQGANLPLTNGIPPAPTPDQLFQYDLNFTSDEYLLQLKAIAFIPAFVNQTQGQILTTLAETLCPGYYNTSFIASGQLVPYLQYDPTTSWAEYAKQFGDASNYRYSCVNKEIHFQPYGDGDLGIVYDETAGQGTFDPTLLQTQSMTNPIVNDITVVGSQEAGNNHEDYFMGDGFTGTFPLRHQVFNAGGQANTSQTVSSGSVLLSDNWSETSFDTQIWNVQDPESSFTLIDNALNIITDLALEYGESYIASYNGLELAGGIIMQHGEFVFNASSQGIVGGVFDDTTLNPDTCETGYLITPTASVVVTASGASGISIQPFRLGEVPAKAFQIITEINHTYVLTTIASSPSPVRYTQVYTTIGGAVFGGESLNADVVGNITWQVQDTNIFTGVVNTYTFAVSGVNFPSYAVYALIDNIQLNLSVTATQLYTPPMGTLNVCSEIGAGLLVPIYISGNQQYTGAYVTPSGGNLPILPGDLGPEQQWPLGSSLQNQSAEIDLGTTVSTLSFYSNDLPGVGTRIRLQTWESQAAVSRIVDTASVELESQVAGDDGHRSAIITNLSPLPRCSEDCDAAGQAYITDRVGNFYQGQYTASYLFFKQQTNDIDFYPVCGRYLLINAPQRGMANTQQLVSSVTTQVIEMRGEIMNHVISYGPDYHLEKVLANFVSQPANVLLPQDTVIQPTPQQLVQVGSYYLPDVSSSNFPTLEITGPTVTLNLNDPIPELGAFYELRSADYNWGQANSNYLLGRFYANQKVVLPRSGYEQLWYLRFVYNSPTGTQAISRRSKVLRVYWPQTPSVPAYLYADSTTINCDFNGDIRNIEGIELRDVSDTYVYYDGIVGSEFDMMLNLDSLRGEAPAGSSVIGGPIGSYMKGNIPIGNQVTTVTQVPAFAGNTYIVGQGNWLNSGYATSTDSSTYAVAAVTGSFTSETFAPILFSGFSWDIPPTATVLGIQLFMDAGLVVGDRKDSSISVQLALNGYPIGPIQTRANTAWGYEVEFGTGTQSPDTTPDWAAVVTAEQLLAGNVGFLVSSTVISTVGEGITVMNSVRANLIYVAAPQRTFNVHFFNLMWEYSPALQVYIPPPPQPQISIGYRWGASLQINVSTITRTDILYTTLQLASASAYFATNEDAVPSGTFNNAGQGGIWYQGQTNGNPASFQVNVPVTGDIYAQVQFQDSIGAGEWSAVLYIPQGNLIASDYLGAQGSVPPTVTNGNLGSGGILAYYSANASTVGSGANVPYIAMSASAFQIVYPNGHVDVVSSLYQKFTYALDTGQLQNSTSYGFFPAVQDPLSPHPTLNFEGPYQNYSGTIQSLQDQFQDGTVPITNGAFVTQTPAPGSATTGGGGGGTGGGGNCATSDRCIELLSGRKLPLKSLTPGMIVRTPSGKGSKVTKKELFNDLTVKILLRSGVWTRCGYGHVLKADGEWKSVEEILEGDWLATKIWTELNDNDRIAAVLNEHVIAEICRIHLEGEKDEDHIYIVDGFWCHNIVVKNGS